ncbi:S9 family peptidase [Pelomonas sp. V22]|uniref:alpha/beta hydrolase family protein n=1 Tax=Pelomonas sp. V22 TaxID=2822139 RepID=UPI0024A828A2|nr:prolyl oligopeptidase family serine peptidase [Pelomonas sp. V22]MDI4634074.1 S9 family peptidase [Pelomonas sp. V22]
MTPSLQRIRWRLLAPLALFAGLAPLPALAQDKPLTPVPAAAFFREADLIEAVLSPSGKRLAVTSAAGGARIGLFVFDLVGGAKPVRVAQFGNVDIRNVAWVSEERLVFSATDYTLGRSAGTDDEGPGLYSVDPQGQSQLELIERKSTIVSDGSRRGLDLNHVLLKIPVPQPGQANEEVLVAKMITGARGEASRMSSLWLNVLTGKTRSTGFAEPAGTIQLMADSRGQARIAITRDGVKQTLQWRGPQDTTWQVLAEGDVMGMPFAPSAIDDAGKLYVSTREAGGGHLVLSAFDFEQKKPQSEPLVRVRGFDFNGQLITSRGNGSALGVRLNSDAETTIWFDPGMKAIQAEVDKRLPNRINRIDCRLCGTPDAVVLVRTYSDRDPGQIWIHRPQPAEGQAAWQPVGAVLNGIDPARMAGVDFQRIKARDGRDLPVWLTLPRGIAPGKPAPAVVLVHGGPWVRGGSWRWNAMPQFLASRGYLVIEPEFRGSDGFGSAHFRAGWKQWGQAMQDDVADALLWARTQKLADDRACIAGASYGGYSTLMGLVRHPELYRCGVAWAAVTDLDLLLKGSWFVKDDASELSRQYGMPEMIGDPEKDAAMLAANSPVLLADKIKAPLLLAFGEADVRVPLAHGERMRQALIKAGNEPQWVAYPGEGHGWGLLKNKIDFAQRLESFLAKHLGPAAP